AAPARAEIEARMKAREMQDRVIAIAEVRGDAPGNWPGHAGRCRGGLLGVAGVDPLVAAVRGPAHQLEVGGGDPVKSGILQVSAVGEDQVETVARRNVAADVD